MKARHEVRRGQYLRAISDVIDSGEFSGGSFVEHFEKEFASYCGTRYAVGVGSGSDALWLTLVAMGIGPGDEVVTVPMTFAATVEAICLSGATPVLVDIDKRTYTMDPSALEKALTSKTKAVIPVHLFGQVAEMDQILEIARKSGIRVIEDAAQAHGAEYKGRKTGSLGDAGCFSFYPSKNLGAFGQAGAVTTDDDDLAQKLRMFRDHGQSRKHHHTVVGWNSRLDGIQAAILGIKLRQLDCENQTRRDHALRYHQEFSDISEITGPYLPDGGSHVFHIYAIQVRDRPRLIQSLNQKQIGFGIHYPIPIHLQEAFVRLGFNYGDFPVAELCAEHFVSLPMFPELTPEQISFVADAVKEAVGVCLIA